MKRTLRTTAAVVLVTVGALTATACGSDGKIAVPSVPSAVPSVATALPIPGTNEACTQNTISAIQGEIDGQCTHNGVTLKHNKNGTVLTGDQKNLPGDCKFAEGSEFVKQGNEHKLNGSITCTWGIPVTFDEKGIRPDLPTASGQSTAPAA